MILGVAAVAVFLAAAPPTQSVEARERTAAREPVMLEVPAIRQSRERCGPAALAMVLRFYGAGPAAIAEAERAYDPVLRGALITDLAAAARRAGFHATVESTEEEGLFDLLRRRIPPVLLYERGIGPIGRGHYGVLVGWDPARRAFVLNDGGARSRRLGQEDLMRRWRAAGAQALIVRPAGP